VSFIASGGASKTTLTRPDIVAAPVSMVVFAALSATYEPGV